jgi:hypothetical protein
MVGLPSPLPPLVNNIFKKIFGGKYSQVGGFVLGKIRK